MLIIIEALPGVLGNRGTRAFISGEQGNKGQILKGTGEQRQYWGTGNIRKQIFDFWGTGEQANLFQGNKEQVPPLGGPHHYLPLKIENLFLTLMGNDTRWGFRIKIPQSVRLFWFNIYFVRIFMILI